MFEEMTRPARGSESIRIIARKDDAGMAPGQAVNPSRAPLSYIPGVQPIRRSPPQPLILQVCLADSGDGAGGMTGRTTARGKSVQRGRSGRRTAEIPRLRAPRPSLHRRNVEVTEKLPPPHSAALSRNINTMHPRALAYGVPISPSLPRHDPANGPEPDRRICDAWPAGSGAPRPVGQRGMRVTREHRQVFDLTGYPSPQKTVPQENTSAGARNPLLWNDNRLHIRA